MESITKVPSRRIETARERRAVESFMAAARHSGPFLVEPTTLDDNPHIGLFLRDGTDLPALAIFQDDLENWTILRKDNLMVQQYYNDEVC